MNKEKTTQSIINILSKHPYLSLLGICLLLNPFFFGAAENVPNYTIWFGAIIVFAAAAMFGIRKYCRGELSRLRLGIFMLCGLTADIAASQLYYHSQNRALWNFVGGCTIIFILYYLADNKKYSSQLKSLLIIGTGLCLKLYYVLITSVYTRQHDVNWFGEDSGHAGYIEYLLFNHKLPDFDVRERWQFCHPPLHHAISAIWIFLNENILQAGHDQSRESLQMLTLFYSGCIIISAYRILRHFRFEGNALYIPLMIISFHPAYILFSGSINNDALSTAFVMGAVLRTLKWYRDTTMKNILKLALCVGLAMMTKISAATAAPSIALVFLIVFIRKFRTDWKHLSVQYICFGIVCIPLGLWYGIRNFIKWKIPLTYVSEVPDYDPQYLGNLSFRQRATDFSLIQIKSPYIQWNYPGGRCTSLAYNEYNPIIAMLKNSVFGEYINESEFIGISYMNVVSFILFWINIIIAGYALFALIKMCFGKCSAEPAEKAFFVSFYIVMLVIFYKNAADYPFVCTMNFRYITPAVVIGAVFTGLSIKENPGNKTLNKLLSVSAAVFSAASTMVYLSIN